MLLFSVLTFNACDQCDQFMNLQNDKLCVFRSCEVALTGKCGSQKRKKNLLLSLSEKLDFCVRICGL